MIGLLDFRQCDKINAGAAGNIEDRLVAGNVGNIIGIRRNVDCTVRQTADNTGEELCLKCNRSFFQNQSLDACLNTKL